MQNEVILPGLAAARVNLLGFSLGGGWPDRPGWPGRMNLMTPAGAVAMAFAKRFPERVWASEGLHRDGIVGMKSWSTWVDSGWTSLNVPNLGIQRGYAFQCEGEWESNWATDDCCGPHVLRSCESRQFHLLDSYRGCHPCTICYGSRAHAMIHLELEIAQLTACQIHEACWCCLIPLAPHVVCTCWYKKERFTRLGTNATKRWQLLSVCRWRDPFGCSSRSLKKDPQMQARFHWTLTQPEKPLNSKQSKLLDCFVTF